MTDLGHGWPKNWSRVDLGSPGEVRFWAKKLNTSTERLTQVVNKVGPMADDVAKELGRIPFLQLPSAVPYLRRFANWSATYFARRRTGTP
jgi:hypothetical protein